MKYLLTFTLFLGLVFVIQGQDRLYKPVQPIVRFAYGQVITSEGDTLTGDIQLRNKGLTTYTNRIMFRDGEGNERFYTAEEIQGFSQKRDNMATAFGSNSLQSVDQDYIYYDAQPQPEGRKAGRMIFMQRLYYSPRISLYLNESGGFSSSTSVNGMAVAEQEFSYYVSKPDQPLFKVVRRKYEDNIDQMFYDCQAVREKLEQTEQLRRFAQLEEVLEMYRKCEY